MTQSSLEKTAAPIGKAPSLIASGATHLSWLEASRGFSGCRLYRRLARPSYRQGQRCGAGRGVRSCSPQSASPGSKIRRTQNLWAHFRQCLPKRKLDTVHVLLPPDRHFAAARSLLESGVHVFLEKPMCNNADDCESLTRIADERGLRVGVGHNFLFSRCYEQLRRDVRSGVLGLIDDVTINWHRPLPAAVFGPFNIWMLRDPRNIMLEIGSHSVAHMLDLVGEPEEMLVHPSNPVDLPTGRKFFRRWQVNAFKGQTAVELRFSFVPGFSEYTIHVRGSLGSATADFERKYLYASRASSDRPGFRCLFDGCEQGTELEEAGPTDVVPLLPLETGSWCSWQPLWRDDRKHHGCILCFLPVHHSMSASMRVGEPR
jgi:predicted dehydrogenase